MPGACDLDNEENGDVDPNPGKVEGSPSCIHKDFLTEAESSRNFSNDSLKDSYETGDSHATEKSPNPQEESEQDKKILAVFNWAYGGKDVFLVKDVKYKNQVLRMVASGTNFTLIQELPLGVYYYGYMVDGVFQHSPDQPTKTVDNELVNVLDVNKAPKLMYKTRVESEEIYDGHFGHNLPGPNYLASEPPAFPDVFYYRSPDFIDAYGTASDIHILANHIYQDSKSEKILGSGYGSYITLYRWANEDCGFECNNRTIAIIYITYIKKDTANHKSLSAWLKPTE
ncbi:bifunctional SNF1-related protein kinase regulatory subunit beta/AMP-activated protein kinase [Babesia duncani]|uniref:Bifunctional SNF1-related protein kinase regulatory subunit beta/AMP-activated protein kinase n=1 Tax=Babesia duncani TaxID=323732 RepID=A0AAD9PM50_9APIC|nr:bifunctional SNF1-related protein kinase regulatory subunit beta/AMP-activated protein kinase [Babesia duncani]